MGDAFSTCVDRFKDPKRQQQKTIVYPPPSKVELTKGGSISESTRLLNQQAMHAFVSSSSFKGKAMQPKPVFKVPVTRKAQHKPSTAA